MLQMLLRNHGDLNILFGKDEYLLSALVLGVRGAVGSTYNYQGVLMNHVLRSYFKGDIATARALQSDHAALVRTINSWSAQTGANGMKLVQNFIGKPRVGEARLPFLTAPKQEVATLFEGVKDWCRTTKDAAPWCT